MVGNRVQLFLTFFILSHSCLSGVVGNESKEITKSNELKEEASMDQAILPSVSLVERKSLNNDMNTRSPNETDGLESSLEEKNVDIRQEDLGKTKQLNDEHKKDLDGQLKGINVDGLKDEKKDEGEKKDEDGKNEETKEKGEEKQEEKGLELKVLKDDNFEHLTQASTGATTGDWLIIFMKNKDCEKCTLAENVLKVFHERMKHKLNVAKVEKDRSTKLTYKRFDLEDDLPVIYLFHHGKQYSYERNLDVDDIASFVDGDYEVAPWKTVKKPYTWFEFYLEETQSEMNHMLRYKKNVSVIIFLAGFISGISVASICGTIMFHLLENFKDDDELPIKTVEQKTVKDQVAAKNKSD